MTNGPAGRAAAVLARAERQLGRLVLLLAGLGAVLVVAQAFWITYGVFVRYVLNKPDRYVTEATALLLIPVAFAGLAFALREDAYPKVEMLVETLPPRLRTAIGTLNLLLMLLIGVFLTLVTGSAALRTWRSGATTEVLSWPEFLFWIPVAVSLAVFVAYAAIRLALRLTGGTPAPEG